VADSLRIKTVGNLGQLVLSKESAFVHCKQMAVFPLPHGRGERGESIVNILGSSGSSLGSSGGSLGSSGGH
jgi:hypothetical protein